MNYFLGEVIKDLLDFCKDSEVPVFLIAQLNRDKDKGAYRFPILSDLKDSGDIENGAHIVIFLDRPEKYEHFDDMDEVPVRQPGKDGKVIKKHFPKKFLTLGHIAKFREVGDFQYKIPMYFNPVLQTFVSHDEHIENLDEQNPAFNKKIPVNEPEHLEQDEINF